MDERPFEVIALAIAVLVGIFLIAIVLGALIYQRKYRANAAAEREKKAKIIRHRPSPLKFDKVRVKRVPTQLTPQPLVITPSTPNKFTIPSRPAYSEDYGWSTELVSSPDGRPSDGKVFAKEPIKLSRTLSGGYGFEIGADKCTRAAPHGKIECFLRHDEVTSSLSVQILGKKGHSLSWLTGISNPYIRVTLMSMNHGESASSVLSSQILNLPLNPECQLEGITKEKLADCLLKFVVLDFDRFSRSEFVADVVVSLGELENLNSGVTVCKDLVPQQKVMFSPRGSLLISLCNQSVAQQLQVIIMKASGIPSKSAVSLAGSDLCVKAILETSELCQKRKTKRVRKSTSYVFNEKFIFKVNSEDLTNASLVFELTRGDSKLLSETKVGLVKLGLDSTSALEMRHWSEMLTSPQKQIAEWHQLHR